MKLSRAGTLAVLILVSAPPAAAQERTDPAERIAAQREAMKVLDRMDGTWRGPSWIVMPSGARRTFTQTERVGPFLDGMVKVIEGRGYEADGTIGFNAFAVISYDPEKRIYNLRSYAQGRAGDFVVRPNADGFVWEIPAGPATIRYTAVIRDGTWIEIAERIVPGHDPFRFIELNLTRLGDTTWPAGGAVELR